jgi:hypothetical protein
MVFNSKYNQIWTFLIYTLALIIETESFANDQSSNYSRLIYKA